MAGMFSKGQKLVGGKYLVLRRDNTVPDWPYFVLGAADPDAADTIRDYANRCERRGLDPEYIKDLRTLADDFDRWREENKDKPGDPDAPRHRVDDPAVIARMKMGA